MGFAMPFVTLSVGKFLGISELATCERARLFAPDMLEQLWSAAGAEFLEGTPLLRYCSSCQDVHCYFPNVSVAKRLSGKQLILDMVSYRRAVLPSEGLRPWITQTS